MDCIEKIGKNMSFLAKKKRFKFQVDFLIADISDVPLVNAVLFAKVRLLEGGNFCQLSQRVEVSNHHVCWDRDFKFTCRIASDPHTGVLETCLCRVSIRKEIKGGKAHQKLGFVDVNLSEFAGSGVDGQTRSYLLEGYNTGQQRQDNSRLRINVSMMLQSADTCFKVPLQHSFSQQGQLNPADRKAPSTPSHTNGGTEDGHSVHSGSSGFESLGNRPSALQKTALDEHPGMTEASFVPGHVRHSSQTSQQSTSQCSDYVSAPPSSGLIPSSSTLTHIRQSSADAYLPVSTADQRHIRRPSSETFMKTMAPSNLTSARVDSTRVDAADVIDGLLQNELNLNTTEEKSGETSGLQLLISKEDGSAVLGGGLAVLNPKVFEQVVISSEETK